MVMTANRLNVIRLCRGQTKVIELKVKTKEGRPASLDGATIYFTAAASAGATPVIAKIGTQETPNGIEFTDPANGVAIITLSSTETDVPVDCYRYDIWVELPGTPPERQCVVANAELRVEPSITTFAATP
jgi:hypothetical protein